MQSWPAPDPGSSFMQPCIEPRNVNIYIDTASPEQLRDADRRYRIDGVTTNPSLVAETDRRYRDVVETADDITGGPVFAQVLAEDADGMVREERGYQDWAENMVEKIEVKKCSDEFSREKKL